MNMRFGFALLAAAAVATTPLVATADDSPPPAPAANATAAPLDDGCPHLASGNVIVDPGAEEAAAATTKGDLVAVPGWTAGGHFTAVVYASSANAFATLSDPIPLNPGTRFFAGGPAIALSTGTQIAAISGMQAGTTPYALCGWFGGYEAQDDSATLTATFLDAKGGILGSKSVGGVKAAARNNATKLLKKSVSGTIPAHAVRVKITLTMTRTDGAYNDGYADNLDFSYGAGSM